MIYLRAFRMPSLLQRELFLNHIKRTCYNTAYPFHLFPQDELPEFTFEPITLFCGGNGCGKSTLLNVIAEALDIPRTTPCNRSSFFDDYVRLCDYDSMGAPAALRKGRIITSDDVFDYLLNIRAVNEGVDLKREDLFDEYLNAKEKGYPFRTMEDYEALKRFNDSRRLTQSSYVKKRLPGNVPERSNGESALSYFTEAIKENALYLLDEPENSLSAQKQQELLQFLQESARFYGCQFIIATHSPFLMAAKGAKVYDLDARPIAPVKWTELTNMRAYFDFFMVHQNEFED